MEADIHTLYQSDFYQIRDFKCRCKDCRTSKPEYSTSFCVSFVRKGNFLFNVFKNSLDSYTGCVLISKPGYERTVTHVHTVPDECTILDFKAEFFQEVLEHYSMVGFLFNNDSHSILIHTTAETEFLHFQIMNLALAKSGSKLQLDNLVLQVVDKVLTGISEYAPNTKINSRIKKNHLLTIERAKEYMTTHFTSDISLMEIANHCHISAFHFSRIFKIFTSISPHQFLLSIRLKNAEMLLCNSSLPVADVAFSSGFNSIEYFTSSFSQKYKCPPAKFRHGHAPAC